MYSEMDNYNDLVKMDDWIQDRKTPVIFYRDFDDT